MRLFVAGVVFALVFFAVQIPLCFTVKQLALRLIPAYIILLIALFATALNMHLIGSGDGFFDGRRIAAIFIFLMLVFAVFGEAVAWVVWAIKKRDRAE